MPRIHRVISFPLPVWAGAFRRRREARRRELEVRWFADDVRAEFRGACQVLGVGYKIDSPTGGTFRTPRVGDVNPGPPVVFMVELLPGQVPADLVAPARRVIDALGGRVAVSGVLGGSWVRVAAGVPDRPRVL